MLSGVLVTFGNHVTCTNVIIYNLYTCRDNSSIQSPDLQFFCRKIRCRLLCTCTCIGVDMLLITFPSVGLRLFYLCIVVYLYGDMAIYAAAVPKSLTQVAW